MSWVRSHDVGRTAGDRSRSDGEVQRRRRCDRQGEQRAAAGTCRQAWIGLVDRGAPVVVRVESVLGQTRHSLTATDWLAVPRRVPRSLHKNAMPWP